MKKKHLRFEEEKLNLRRKTKFFRVFNDSDECLGVIHWRNGWRCYVMSYEDGVDMSVSCSDELNLFLHRLENEK